MLTIMTMVDSPVLDFKNLSFSQSPTVVLSAITRTITPYQLLMLLGSNHLLSLGFVDCFHSDLLQDAVVADLDKEIAGLEGLMRDLNEITAGDYLV